MKAYEAPELRKVAVETTAVLLASTGLIEGNTGNEGDSTLTIHAVGGIDAFR